MNEQSNASFDVTKISGGGATTGDDLISKLVGDDKKFKTVNDLAKGKLESDTFIERLQTENKALREALDDADTTASKSLTQLNELISRANSNGTQGQASTTTTMDLSNVLKREDVPKLLAEMETMGRAKTNRETFNRTVSEAFGDKANEMVAAKLTELSVTPEAFLSLVTQNPSAAAKLLDIKLGTQPNVTGNATREGSVNTEAAFSGNGNASGERNFEYYNKLRREMKHGFYSTEIQQAMFNDRKAQGDAFWKK